MKFCFITSIPHLNDFALKSNYHLILTHLVESDWEYEDFYRKRKTSGDYIILDNSFYELNESVSTSRILKAIQAVHPNEVVAYEMKNVSNKSDLYEYKNLLSKFAEKVKNSYKDDIKIQAVIKGNSLDQYLNCYEMIENHPDISVIGIPVNMSKVLRREMFFNILIRKGLLSKKEHHLLGLEFPEELKVLKSLVRSCDSSLPFWMGVWGIKIQKYGLPYKKIKDKMDFDYQIEHKEQYRIIQHNIKQIKRFIMT